MFPNYIFNSVNAAVTVLAPRSNGWVKRKGKKYITLDALIRK